MNFWIFATALLVISAVFICWPFFTGSLKEKMLGIWVLVLIPMAGLLLYQQIGTPSAIDQPTAVPQQRAASQQPHDPQQPQMNEMLAKLQKRLAENPDDPDGWIILGRSLKAMDRYSEAVTALGNANRLMPGNAMIMVELAEAKLFASGEPNISEESIQLLTAALEIDPTQQKGMWLLGMASEQKGDHAQAIAIWKKLLSMLDPASGAAQSVTDQIEMATTKLGEMPTPQAVAEPEPALTGVHIPVTLTLDSQLAQDLPPSAVLYIFVHPAGGAGMPLAVKRIGTPVFPLSLTLGDADTLRPGTSLADFDQIDVVARISMTGIANAASGDYQANRITLDTKAVTEIALHLDQGVP